MAKETIIHTALSNGLSVKLKRQPFQRTVSMGMFVRHGAQNEDARTSGAAHFIEHALFNPNHMSAAPRDLLNDLLDQGMSFEAYTAKEYTRFVTVCTPALAPEAIRFISYLTTHRSLCSPEAVAHERPIILHEHASVFSSSRILTELLDSALWGDKSLGLFVIGRKENINRFNHEELNQQLLTSYVPHRSTLAVLGDLDLNVLDRLITDHFEPWADQPSLAHDPMVTLEPRAIALPTGANRAELILGFPGPQFGSNDRFTADLLADILGGGIKSRLFAELRERQQKVYSVYAFTQAYALGGYLAIHVNCDKADIAGVVQSITREVQRLVQDGVTQSELSRVRAARATALMGVLENGAQHLQVFGRRAVLNQDFFVDVDVREMNSITTEDIRRVASKVFVFDNLAIVALGPKQEDLLALI